MSRNRVTFVIVASVVLVGALTTVGYFYYLRGPNANVTLPAGCSRPDGGFLIVAAYNGFNDSVDHGVQASSWPVINVRQGANVTIEVCNADTQAHGFQISHYYDGKIVALAPGQVIKITFTADQTGKFQIYCSILCTVHWAMISGQLNVS